MQVLYTIAFNFNALIERKINKTYDRIYDSWYTNCIVVKTGYEIRLHRL